MYRIATILALAMLLQSVIVTILTYFKAADFLIPPSHAWNTSIGLFVTTGSLFATLTLFNVCCFFIMRRIHCINLILNQLIFDEMISDEFIFLNSNHRILSHEFSHNDNFQSEKATKWLPFKWHWYGKINSILSKQMRPFRVRDDDGDDDDDNMKNASHKRWPMKKGMWIETDDISERQHLDNLMRTFNLSDVQIILSRM